MLFCRATKMDCPWPSKDIPVPSEAEWALLASMYTCGTSERKVTAVPPECGGLDFLLNIGLDIIRQLEGTPGAQVPQIFNNAIRSKYPSGINLGGIVTSLDPPTLTRLSFINGESYLCAGGRLVLSGSLIINIPRVTVILPAGPVNYQSITVEGNVLISLNAVAGEYVISNVVVSNIKISGFGSDDGTALIALITFFRTPITNALNSTINNAVSGTPSGIKVII